MRLPGKLQGKRLDGEQFMQFQNALIDAFPVLPMFDQMLQLGLNKNRQRIALGDALEDIVFRILIRAESEAWTAELLQSALKANPDNPELLLFAGQFNLAPISRTRQELERTIKRINPMLDVDPWLTGLGKAALCVCHIKVSSGGETDLGTGFLLGSDVVITNYHVMERVIKGSVQSKRVKLIFDYKKMSDGTILNQGVVYRLPDDDWLIHASQYSEFDKVADPGSVPNEDQLDFTLLRVIGTPGNDPISSNPISGVHVRHWIDVPLSEYDFKDSKSIFILQHPVGMPLKLALDTEAEPKLNDNGTRVRYTTNTEPGSSGSPCFDANWNLVALHHAGDPNYSEFYHPTYNQGIPFKRIVELLEDEGKADVLGK